jgi:hypothetical protein
MIKIIYLCYTLKITNLVYVERPKVSFSAFANLKPAVTIGKP